MVDYSCYLVTDSSLVHHSRNLVDTVQQAVDAGVTIVQLREKELETGAFIELARKLLEITKKANIPLLINDRVDVALAVDADGVHIGQDDMPLSIARRLLGNGKIIGVTAATIEEAKVAVENGADYIGIGACFGTSTKKLKKIPMGPRGVLEILEALPANAKAVTIGGINSSNAERVIRHSHGSDGRKLEGVAVVSDIVAAENVPEKVAELKQAIARGFINTVPASIYPDELKLKVAQVFDKLRATSPLVHHITNFVVMNDTANATLALGGSPIMAQNIEEVHELGKFVGSLLLNIGTLNNEFVTGMVGAGKAANKNRTPIILDPVGAGASSLRKSTMKLLTDSLDIGIVKGNAGEISCLAGTGEVEMRGVDSVGGTNDGASMVTRTSKLEKSVIAMTGVVDYVSDGHRTYSIHNGHEYLGKITGSGCMATTAIACYAADDLLVAAIAGLASMGVAAEYAAKRSDVNGPNTFKAALIDELHNLTAEKLLQSLKLQKC
ncbi:hypothetical protein HK103_001719 [Boothiomyces macroporosus]|uniref:Thiamine phosphate synthase/TenI domain-containing protein n=1 Tax=Boothiomyces macroporosus TaxID=261099 RepID=A0AAD5UKC1_9FUNG|nr:hypothetical protein HK103_001719 [Boothiomyces macroporosus]